MERVIKLNINQRLKRLETLVESNLKNFVLILDVIKGKMIHSKTGREYTEEMLSKHRGPIIIDDIE